VGADHAAAQNLAVAVRLWMSPLMKPWSLC
jgi:hypothetical protein